MCEYLGGNPECAMKVTRRDAWLAAALHLLPVWIHYDRSEREHIG